jgi:hypothetical protein
MGSSADHGATARAQLELRRDATPPASSESQRGEAEGGEGRSAADGAQSNASCGAFAQFFPANRGFRGAPLGASRRLRMPTNGAPPTGSLGAERRCHPGGPPGLLNARDKWAEALLMAPKAAA